MPHLAVDEKDDWDRGEALLMVFRKILAVAGALSGWRFYASGGPVAEKRKFTGTCRELRELSGRLPVLDARPAATCSSPQAGRS
jgi:hypothetical protein